MHVNDVHALGRTLHARLRSTTRASFFNPLPSCAARTTEGNCAHLLYKGGKGAVNFVLHGAYHLIEPLARSFALIGG